MGQSEINKIKKYFVLHNVLSVWSGPKEGQIKSFKEQKNLQV